VEDLATKLVEGQDLQRATGTLREYATNPLCELEREGLREGGLTKSGESAGLLYWVIDRATRPGSGYDYQDGDLVRKLPEVCRLLVCKVGCDVNQPNSKGETPLHLAVKRNRQDIVWLLLQAGAKTSVRDSEDKAPIDYAQDDGMEELLRAYSPGVVTRP